MVLGVWCSDWDWRATAPYQAERQNQDNECDVRYSIMVAWSGDDVLPHFQIALYNQEYFLKSSTIFQDSWALANSVTSCPNVFLTLLSAPLSTRKSTCSSSSRYTAL